MSGPDTFVANDPDTGVQGQMSSLISDYMSTNTPFTVTGPFASNVLSGASALNTQDANSFGGQSSAASPSVPMIPPTTAASGGSKTWYDSVLDGLSASGGASSVAVGPASQLSAAGSSSDDSAAAASGGGWPTAANGGYAASAQGASEATAPIAAWVSAHAGNYGLVILGVVLAVGALLISQKQTIVSIGKTVGKVAAVAG